MLTKLMELLAVPLKKEKFKEKTAIVQHIKAIKKNVSEFF